MTQLAISAPPPTRTHHGRHPSLPPFLEAAADLRQQIDNGHLLPGHRLPPLRAMAEHYGICVATARSALKVLQDEGRVYTRQGRGSFVAARPAVEDTTTAPATSHPCECATLGRRIDELTTAVRDLLRLTPQNSTGHQTAAQT
ncbi:GntR family transcriptional regulator [Streptomyces sp. NPDC056056]|uniref:GntR family transcriptional regulator n=1 Tax=Streptomyces sp. NPDC056056 TaxID=3345698 RepID=UPI0035DA7C86